MDTILVDSLSALFTDRKTLAEVLGESRHWQVWKCTAKMNQHTSKFIRIYWQILLTQQQTDRQTDRQTGWEKTRLTDHIAMTTISAMVTTWTTRWLPWQRDDVTDWRGVPVVDDDELWRDVRSRDVVGDDSLQECFDTGSLGLLSGLINSTQCTATDDRMVLVSK